MSLRRSLAPLALSVLAAAAPAQAVDWSHAARVDIGLSNFKFEPSTVTLEHGKPYVLHLVNHASGGHDFVARKFFDAALVTPNDQPAVVKGSVELEGGDSADVRVLAPAPGRYDIHCSHFMHSSFGMKGEIVVT